VQRASADSEEADSEEADSEELDSEELDSEEADSEELALVAEEHRASVRVFVSTPTAHARMVHR
jgi:hypothetical protein